MSLDPTEIKEAKNGQKGLKKLFNEKKTPYFSPKKVVE